MKAVNLLPDAKPQGGRGGRAARLKPGSGPAPAPAGLVLLAPLLAILVVLVLAVKAGNDVNARKAELDRVNAEQVVASATEAQLKPYHDFATLAVARVTTVSQIAKSRFDWEQVLRDLSRALPRDVTLSAIDASVSSGGSRGGSGGLRSAIAAPAVELTGCTVHQSSVARLMGRLRNIQGVTRVSLAKSEKDNSGGEGGGAVTSSVGGNCGKGDKPTFSLVMFFENDAAGSMSAGTSPVSTGGPTGPTGPAGSAAPGAPATQPASNTSAQPASSETSGAIK